MLTISTRRGPRPDTRRAATLRVCVCVCVWQAANSLPQNTRLSLMQISLNTQEQKQKQAVLFIKPPAHQRYYACRVIKLEKVISF